MNEPAPLPWDDIKAEVEKAAMRIGKSRMLGIRDIVDHILSNPGEYPAIMKPREWSPTNKPVNSRQLFNRIHNAVNGNNLTTGLLWPKWSAGRANNHRGTVFILPWKEEDPVVVRAREELSAES